MLTSTRKRRPATAASEPATAKVIEIVRLTLIPIMAAASRSCAVARIDFPWRGEVTDPVRGVSTGKVNMMTGSLVHSYETPAPQDTFVCGRSLLAAPEGAACTAGAEVRSVEG